LSLPGGGWKSVVAVEQVAERGADRDADDRAGCDGNPSRVLDRNLITRRPSGKPSGAACIPRQHERGVAEPDLDAVVAPPDDLG
jgi:hypothetical protein